MFDLLAEDIRFVEEENNSSIGEPKMVAHVGEYLFSESVREEGSVGYKTKPP